MEGALSKWTNVMNGWQYRYFVLDENSGLLSYYTSKDRMRRGARRGCVRLKGAVVGIDDEDDSTFTITVDQKTFHFQAANLEEREQWVAALERTILIHSSSGRSQTAAARSQVTIEEYDHRLMETDAYLQLLIEQIDDLERRIEQCPDLASKERYSIIQQLGKAMIESIKHTIVMLQISKESLKEPVMNGSMHYPPLLTTDADYDHYASTSKNEVPETSYSSSEDEEFFDAEDLKSGKLSPEKQAKAKAEAAVQEGTSVDEAVAPPPVITAVDDYFDELYDEKDSEDLGSLEQHGSIISHLLSQVRIGMDLTKVVLPTFILERRSLLEFYGDFFAHPDLFVRVADMETPRDRMVQLLRWYLSAFHAGRQSEIAKKPYNPILGEIFRCHWTVPGFPADDSQGLAEGGPVPWATKNNLTFIAEQVSHHPPISAFYAEHFNNRITLDGYIWTKSKFLGLSIGVHMIGKAVVSVIDHDEEYTITFPNGYGRSILTTPWIEMGGSIQLSCAKTGYSATVEFHTKPFYGGKKHRVTASAFEPNEKKPFMTVEGEWNGIMYAKYTSGRSEVFVDTTRMPIIKKKVKPRDQQVDMESRRLWSEVTHYLKNKNVEMATDFKRALEQQQRDEAKERKEKGEHWETKNFHEVGEHWVFDRPLLKRLTTLKSSSKSSSPATARSVLDLASSSTESLQQDPSFLTPIPSTSTSVD